MQTVCVTMQKCAQRHTASLVLNGECNSEGSRGHLLPCTAHTVALIGIHNDFHHAP